MPIFDVVIVTAKAFVQPSTVDPYIRNVLYEDELIIKALRRRGLQVWRTHWDNPAFDWENTRYALIRAVWDYMDQPDAFRAWLDVVNEKTHLINPHETLIRNFDKHYLLDFENAGLQIPPTIFIEAGDPRSLSEVCRPSGWSEYVLKPAISGGGRHTYRFDIDNLDEYNEIYQKLVAHESMMLQRFIPSVITEGEATLVYFGGAYSHAILKRAKAGDYRVQDDFGGTVHAYKPSTELVEYCTRAMKSWSPTPVYGRVDIIWDEVGDPMVSEMELFEPELWLRNHALAAERFAEAVELVL